MQNPQAPPTVLALYALGLMGLVLFAWANFLSLMIQKRALWPRLTQQRVPWGIRTCVGAFGIYVLVTILTIAGYQILVRNQGAEPILSPFEQMGLLSVINALAFLLIVWPIRRIHKANLSHFCWNQGQSHSSAALGGAWMFLWSFPLITAMALIVTQIWKPTAHPLEDMIREQITPFRVVLAFLSAVIVAPIFEEFLFRGLLQQAITQWFFKKRRAETEIPTNPVDVTPGMWDTDFEPITDSIPKPPEWAMEANVEDWAKWSNSSNMESTAHQAADQTRLETQGEKPSRDMTEIRISWFGLWIPNIASSILFAGLHYSQWPAPMALFVLSLGLGYVYQRTGNLVAPIVMHLMFNGNSTVILLMSLISER